MRLKHSVLWRLLEPVFLGFTANIVINFIFNPTYPDFIFKEFFVAVAFAVVVTETNRYINIFLNRKYSWTTSFTKRFIHHFIYLTLSLLIVLNVIGNLYLWISGNGFYTINEVLIINLSVFILSLLLTLIKCAIHFYNNWRATEYSLNRYAHKLDTLKSQIDKSTQRVELTIRNNSLKISSKEIKYAHLEHGVVWVYYNKNGKAIFNGSLSRLKKELPGYLFFQVNRTIILRRDVIFSISSSTYGKIDVTLNDQLMKESILTVSRPKAASFRKWYYSTSDAY